MKKILVTGAAGSIGIWVLKYLLSEGKYEITALDLKTREVQKKLKKYHKRINVIYGDVEDPVLIDALIKEHDYVIHLAGIMPPLCNLSPAFGEKIDLVGTENIVRSISFYNPNCFLIYPSTTVLEKNQNVKNLIEVEYFGKTKEKCENLIKEKLKNYVLFRMPFVLGNLKTDKAVYLYKLNEEVELITNQDAAYALVKVIEYKKELNKKCKILTGGKNCRINSTDLIIRILETYGYSYSLLWNKIFKPYKYNGQIFRDDKNLNHLLNYQNDSIDSYFMCVMRTTKKRNIGRALAKPLKRKLERERKK